MKRVAVFLIAVLAILVSLPDPGNAQTSATPTLNGTLYKYVLASAKTYANSQTDTLPQPTTAGTVVTFRGAPSFASLVMEPADSAVADVYLDGRAIGMTTFTVLVTDSIKGASTLIPTKEWILRNHATDNLIGLDLEYRVRIAWRSAGNGTTTPTYTLKFMWKP